MGSYKWYKYVELRQMQNSKKPANQLLMEDATYGLYFIDNANPDSIVKTTDEGVTVSTVYDIGGGEVINVFYKSSYDFYIGYAGAGAINSYCEYIELDNSDNVVDLGQVDSLGGGSRSLPIDFFEIGGSLYCHYLDIDNNVVYITKYNVGWADEDSQALAGAGLYGAVTIPGLVIGTLYYFAAYESTDADVKLYKFDSTTSTISLVKDLGAYSYTIGTYRLLYDDDDIISLILTTGGNPTLVSYSITGDTITEQSTFKIIYMGASLSLGTGLYSNIKGFYYGGDTVHIYLKEQNQTLKIADLGLSGETIIAISDNYIITSNSDLYKYTESLSKLIASGHEENIFSVPTCSITYSSEMATDQLIEIYFYSDIRADYTLVFRGKVGIGELDDRGRWNYNMVNLGAKDFAQSVSYTASATGIDEVVIALVGQLTNPYIWCDTDSVPNIATNMTYVFDNSTLWDALYVCAVLANAYFWVTADGCLYFRTYASMEQTGWYLGSGGLNYETVGTSGTSIAWVDSATLYNGACEIVESWQDHKNVLALKDDADAGEDPNISHTITQATAGVWEGYIGAQDTGASRTIIYFYETATAIVQLRIASDSIDYYDHLGVYQAIQAVADDTLYHLKVQWYADNTFDITIDETLKVDGVQTANNQVSGVNNLQIRMNLDTTYYFYLDSPGLVGEVDPRNVTYVAGYNDEDTLNQATNNISYPTSERMESKFNIWDIDGGWNEAANAPFNKRETDEEHILQYGPNQWTGRDTFSGARTQAALDAIAAGLKAWQGMMDAPYNASFRLIGRWYYPIGKYMNFQFTPETTFATAADMLISRCSYDHKNPKMVWMTLTQNIVRMG